MQKVVLATGNAGKVRELASLLNDFGLDVVAQTELGVDSAEETGLTFIENAILKARHAAQITGLPAIADDSGLAVDCGLRIFTCLCRPSSPFSMMTWLLATRNCLA
ncbi:non-canonical purine NTP pyrophosphatase, partial [Enterobacter hormaechei subsp. steigerwaltii]|nr:non-canonical purine NTP pyrophosphatase [Enterobacter hormaechei subsp. steigerwaltii]